MPTDVVIPENAKKVVAKAQTEDDSLGMTNFAAAKPETAKALLKTAQASLAAFKIQAGREEFETRVKLADQYYRCAQNQTKQDQNLTADVMNTAPEIFHEIIRTISAWETDILLYQPKLPIRFEAFKNLPKPEARQDAQGVAESQNSILEYSMEVDDRKAKIANFMWNVNRYTVGVYGMHWHQETVEIKRRGKGGKLKTETKKRCFPKWTEYDMADVFFDARIPNLQDQQCIWFLSRPTYGDLLREQKDHHYQNVELVSKKHLYDGETPTDTVEDRQKNAGETAAEKGPTGAFGRADIFMRAAVNDKGDIDEKNTAPRWIWMTILASDVESAAIDADDPKEGSAVCVRLMHNPYYLQEVGMEIPFVLAHSHRDAKGAFSLGFVDILDPAYSELKTTLDQWFNMRNSALGAPWVTEQGAILNTDKTLHPDKLLVMQAGKMEMLKKLKVEIFTNDMMAFANFAMDRIKKAAGVTRPFEAEPMGGRTSAFEARGAWTQAQRPAIDKLRFNSSEMLAPMAKLDAAMWRQFAPEDLVISVMGGKQIQEVKPASLAGPIRVRLSAVEEYEHDSMVRLEMDKFFQIGLPLVAQSLGKNRLMQLFRIVFTQRGVFTEAEADTVFGVDSDESARMQAREENAKFLDGVWDEPKKGENHEIHNDEHLNFKTLYKALPDADDNVVGMLESHMAFHDRIATEEMQMNMQTAGAAGGQGQGEEGAAPGPQGQRTPEMAGGMPAGGGTPSPGEASQALMGEQLGGLQ